MNGLATKTQRPTLNNLIASLIQLQKEGHGEKLIELAKDAEGNGYSYLNNIESLNEGIVTLWPSHETHY